MWVLKPAATAGAESSAVTAEPSLQPPTPLLYFVVVPETEPRASHTLNKCCVTGQGLSHGVTSSFVCELCVCVICMSVGIHAPQHAYGGQRTILRSWFPLFSMRAFGV